VAMTADAIEVTKQKYLKAGMVDMISKPIDPEQVYKTVLNWVKKHRGIRRNKRRPVSIELEDTTIETKVENDQSKIETPVIQGINVREGIKRFANRWDFFKRLLQRFYFDHISFIKEFNELKDADREAAERMLHSFKGISGTIAAPALYNLAIKVEHDFKHNEPTFSEGFIELSKELETILEELSKNEDVDIEGFGKQN